MNRIRISRIALLVVVTLAFALPTVAADRGSKVVDAAWAKAMKANDLDGVMACYAADAVLWFPGAPKAEGAKVIRALYEGFFAANRVQDVVTTNVVYQTSGNLSTAWGNYSMTILPKGASGPVTLQGRFTEVTALRDGLWVYIADHASAEPEAPK